MSEGALHRASVMWGSQALPGQPSTAEWLLVCREHGEGNGEVAGDGGEGGGGQEGGQQQEQEDEVRPEQS